MTRSVLAAKTLTRRVLVAGMMTRRVLVAGMMTRRVLVAGMLVASLCAGCTHVKPYEREHLTRAGMDTKREALAERFVAHVQDAREGGGGSTEHAGGGCGCN